MPSKRSKASPKASRTTNDTDAVASPLRIIGGTLRGRTIEYSGDPRTRPMKDRTREAVFNLLGPSVKGVHAIDLFAGTGALGLEAISRGAAHATMIERHFPTARSIERVAAQLDIAEKCTVIASDTFFWGRRHEPLVARSAVFCSPPYALYTDRRDDLLRLLRDLMAEAPPESRIIVEADSQFDFGLLPDAESWNVREYAPAVVGIYIIPENDSNS